MTPAARLSAAIEVLDRYLEGDPAEKALTNWARRSRYAGSKDRAAVRDIVFDALRCLRSHSALGGALSGRGLVLGGLRAKGKPPEDFFTGEGYAPSRLSEDEIQGGYTPKGNEELDCPDWLAEDLRESLGDDFHAVLTALQKRASVFLRVNLAKATLDQAIAQLQAEVIQAKPHDLSDTALEVTEGARRIHMSDAYKNGWIELQDVASQAVVECLPLKDGMRILDYCAGGGGKTLAMAGKVKAEFYAYDISHSRICDLSARAERAGVDVEAITSPSSHAPYDLVLCDVPCSGSGAWRRSPEGKWLLSEKNLSQLVVTQSKILDEAKSLVANGGVLAYATCSLLQAENKKQIDSFLNRFPNWQSTYSRQFTPKDGGDGFFITCLTERI